MTPPAPDCGSGSGNTPPAERRFKGHAASSGCVVAPVLVLSRISPADGVREFQISGARVSSEIARFEEAKKETRRQIEALNDELAASARPEDAAIFEGHAMLLEDEMLHGSIVGRISSGRINAEAAVIRSVKEFRSVFERMSDRYMRERAADLDDLGRRLLANLAGGGDSRFDSIVEPCIIVADDISPSETVSLPKGLVLGFATDRGSVTSHAALIARALGIPAVVGLGNVVRSVQPGDMAALDGDCGELILSPSPATVAAVGDRSAAIRGGRRAPQAIGPVSLADGRVVSLSANVQDGIPLASIAESGACGVGLYRSEYLWLRESREPSEDEQAAAYSRVAGYVATSVYPGARTVIRVLDIGGDKLLPGVTPEPNPFLGNRSLRFLLSSPAVFRAQLRAILRASARAPVAVMYPMVATLDELRAANAELSHAMSQLAFAGIPFDPGIRRGAMIELPSAALNAAAIAAETDFLSIGTNDLVQYTLGADRGNDSVAYLYQPLNPAMLKLVDMTARAAAGAGIPVAVCGESASDPVAAAVWVALGVDELSMSCGYVPSIRRALSALSSSALDGLAAEIRKRWDRGTAADMQDFVRGYLSSHVSDPASASLFQLPGNV